MEQLLNKLKAEDKRNLKLTKGLQIVYWIFAPLYAALYIFNPDDELNFSHRIAGAFFVLAFIAFALLFRYLKKVYQTVDYSLPTLEMLEKAAKRYKLWQPISYVVFIPVLFIDVAISIMMVAERGPEDFYKGIINAQLFFIPSIAIGVLVGIIIWHKRQKPLRDHALKLIKEMQNG